MLKFRNSRHRLRNIIKKYIGKLKISKWSGGQVEEEICYLLKGHWLAGGLCWPLNWEVDCVLCWAALCCPKHNHCWCLIFNGWAAVQLGLLDTLLLVLVWCEFWLFPEIVNCYIHVSLILHVKRLNHKFPYKSTILDISWMEKKNSNQMNACYLPHMYFICLNIYTRCEKLLIKYHITLALRVPSLRIYCEFVIIREVFSVLVRVKISRPKVKQNLKILLWFLFLNLPNSNLNQTFMFGFGLVLFGFHKYFFIKIKL